ncbi:uncharacterized protein LOC135841233 [Planococcus citri]|uniref:uncharacterized protein LOC135841233 n=1 Tax=Planococcus citri TaxID=170843 RepID=UPI0031F8583D
MFRENDFQAMKILIEEDQENNILNALGLFEKKKLIDAQEKLSAESKHIVIPDKRRSELFGIPVSKSKSKLDNRRSLRIHTKSTDDFGNHVPSKFSKIVCPFYSDSDTEHHKVRIRKKHTSNSYGSVKGVSIGDKWNTRVECSHAGVHKPTVASIHAGKDGAYSVAICGDYEDDQDNGYCFTYTASIGRDLSITQVNRKNVRTSPQCRNQSTEGASTSLIRSIETRNPVRVIRGYKLDSPFAPETGYRYDGLYTVENYWTCVGKSGYVYKFLLKRCYNQAPAPWHRREPLNRIRIVKIRRKRPKNISTVLNFSGKLTMNEENGDQITTCEVSQMQLKLNTDMMSDSVTIESSAVFLNKDCEERLNPGGTLSYQTANVSEDDPEKKSSTDDSNKENSNKVIIKTRWRRSRLSLPIVKNGTSLPSESSTETRSRTRQHDRRLSYTDRRSIKRSCTIQRSQQPKTPPKIAYFNVSNDQSFKWSLFASEEEIKIFQKYFRNKKTKYNHAADYEGEFKGFERQESLNKVGLMILGFIINDIEMKQRSK